MTQDFLFDRQNPAPILPVDPHVTEPAEQKRLSATNQRILHRLRQGPATRRELGEMTLAVTQRISDLRAAGYDVKVTENRTSGSSLYTLIGGPK